ncbi:MAG: hypothetical protein CMI02_03710 [Oceanospirillaceae bacterium]|nr:hypothetical protein [Oceanospirillaceae bacterium]MBT11125.1 hypothetical protein [Oceanospirillaceae bacterium]|tara:strand:+ start:4275 stop:4808 length:534 start_codon:yes stop_codon:yes gene_type:complete
MKNLIALTLLTLSLLAPATNALPHDLDRLRLKDQHDTPVKIPTDTRYVVFAHDMSSKDLVEEWLESKDDGFMKNNRIVYVVNISGMPRIIARMFAFPALRKLPYQVIIDEVGQKTGDWETRDSAVSVFTVKDLSVTDTAFIDDSAELDALISGKETASAAEQPAPDAAEESATAPAE